MTCLINHCFTDWKRNATVAINKLSSGVDIFLFCALKSLRGGEISASLIMFPSLKNKIFI